MAIAYIMFGALLVAIMAAAIFYYYSGKRHKRLEEPKYKMLEDD